MNNLYIIGGSTRSGKTTILNRVISRKPMIAIQTDAIREGIRRSLINESFASISNLSFNGDVTFHRLGEDVNIVHTKQFSQSVSQDELIWNAIVGIINYYDNQSVDIIIEGMEITPERVSSLTLKNYNIKAAFVSIIKYADNDEMIKDLSSRMEINDSTKKWLIEEQEERRYVSKEAVKYDYRFFEFKDDDFDRHCDSVANYLLEDD